MSKFRFLIGREKPGVDSEVARLISETVEQETSMQKQPRQDDETVDQETENEENIHQPEEPQPNDQTACILQQGDHVKQEDQPLAGEKNKIIMVEVREKHSSD